MVVDRFVDALVRVWKVDVFSEGWGRKKRPQDQMIVHVYISLRQTDRQTEISNKETMMQRTT